MNGQLISPVGGLITLFIERVGDGERVKWLRCSCVGPREPRSLNGFYKLPRALWLEWGLAVQLCFHAASGLRLERNIFSMGVCP